MGFILSCILLIMVLICMILDTNIHIRKSSILFLPRSMDRHLPVIHMRLPRQTGTKIFTHTLFLTPILLHFHNPWHQVIFNISNYWKGTTSDPPPKNINN